MELTLYDHGLQSKNETVLITVIKEVVLSEVEEYVW